MSILINLLRDIFFSRQNTTPCSSTSLDNISSSKKVLNVGGNNKSIPIPSHYAGWQHDLLDIDPSGNPDIVCDARKLVTLSQNIYDAVYCSHNLEHYYRHDGLLVVKGFHHILKQDGFVEIRVPDISQVISALQTQRLGLDDVMYVSPAGPITAHDIIYGFQYQIERSGQDFYAHKTGFTPESLAKVLFRGGFSHVVLRVNDMSDLFSVHALAFKAEPSPALLDLLAKTWNINPNELITP